MDGGGREAGRYSHFERGCRQLALGRWLKGNEAALADGEAKVLSCLLVPTCRITTYKQICAAYLSLSLSLIFLKIQFYFKGGGILYF